MVHGVPGQHGRSVMAALGRPLAPGSVTALPPGSGGCPVLERAGRAAVAMTTSLSAQVSIIKGCILIVYLYRKHSCTTSKGGYWMKMRSET